MNGINQLIKFIKIRLPECTPNAIQARQSQISIQVQRLIVVWFLSLFEDAAIIRLSSQHLVSQFTEGFHCDFH